MGVGTSMGAYYDDSFHAAAAKWDSKYDNNEIAPDMLMNSMAVVKDPNNIYDDSGSIVDYATPQIQAIPKFNPMNVVPDELPLIQQQSMKNQMPFPDNKNPDTDFASRFPKDMKSGILNDLKPQTTDRPLIRKM